MRQANREFLEEFKWAKESYSMQSPPRTMDMRHREQLQRIAIEEFGYGKNVDLWCDSCLKDFILNTYLLYEKGER